MQKFLESISGGRITIFSTIFFLNEWLVYFEVRSAPMISAFFAFYERISLSRFSRREILKGPLKQNVLKNTKLD